jgi:hypothetical protein
MALDSSSATRLTMLCGIKTAARRRTKVAPRIGNTRDRRFVVLTFKASYFVQAQDCQLAQATISNFTRKLVHGSDAFSKSSG